MTDQPLPERIREALANGGGCDCAGAINNGAHEPWCLRNNIDALLADNAERREQGMSESMFAGMVAREIDKARAKHAPVNSWHEGYAVILEELDEFWDEVKAYGPKWSEDDRAEWRERVLRELVQVGAMAQRVAEDCV